MKTKSSEPRERYDRLVRAAQQLPPVTTAIAHPCDKISIEGVVEAAKLGLIAPILLGPPARIREAAQQAEPIFRASRSRNRRTAMIRLRRPSTSCGRAKPRP